jgi:hypothetical protein
MPTDALFSPDGLIILGVLIFFVAGSFLFFRPRGH